VPGPTLRARVGDRVTIELTNALDAATSIHWHGLGVPEDMDGMDAVRPGETRTYTFTADAARTAWYHPHVDTDAQVDAGLYGFVVVSDPAEPVAERELLLAFDVLAELDDAAAADTGMSHGGPPPPPGADTGVHAGHGSLTDPNRLDWVVNGRLAPRLLLDAGTLARARVLNASNAAYLDLRAPETRVIAGDQGLRDVLGSAAPVLAPGDRVELELRAAGSFSLDAAPYSLDGGPAVGAPRAVVTVDVAGSAAAPEGLAWPFGGQAPSEDPAYTDLYYVLEGADGDWSINGERWPDVTAQTVALGSRPVIEVRNLSATRHPFHTHGNAFEVLSIDGAPVTERRFEDTFDVGIRQRVRLRLHADNPGAWMVHCHVLGHEDTGMMTLLRVE
jgi:FtsP/CotA-like multicopper oxidase with cupredoxin domain